MKKSAFALFPLLALLFLPPLAAHADYYWDTISGNNQVDGGTGSWNVGSNWTADGGTNNAAWANGQIVHLQATPGTVTISGTVAPNNVRAHTNGYVITGGTLNWVGNYYFQPDSGVDLRVESAITKSSGLNIGFSGGRTVLAGNNSGLVGGLLNMDGGTLRAASDSALGSGTIFWNGGRFEVEGTRTYTNALSGSTISFGGSGNLTLTADFNFGTGSITFNNNGTGIAILAGKISGGDALADNISINGGGVVGLTNAANDYTGTVLIGDGGGAVLRTGNDAAGLSANANLKFNGGVMESRGTFNRTLGTAAGQVQWNSGQSGGFAAYGGKLTVDLDTLGTRDSISWGSPFVVGPGTLTFGSATANNEVEFYDNLSLGADRTITVNDNPATAADKAVLSGVISGPGNSLSKAGFGVLELTGTNTFSGLTQITKGSVRGAFGVGIPNASYIQFNNSVGTDPAIWESNGTESRQIQNVPGSVFWGGHGGFAAVGGAFTLTLESGSTLTWGNQYDGFSGYNLQLNSANGTDPVTINNNINLGGAARTIVVFDNPELTTDRGRLVGNLSGTGGSLLKRGAGTLELTGSNTYDSGTTVSEGTLLANNPAGSATGSGAVAVTNATLGGTGRVAGAVTAQANATLAPGASAGSLELGSTLDLQALATLSIQLAGTNFTFNGTEQYDRLKVTGATTLAGSLSVSLDSFSLGDNQLFGILDAVGGLSGSFNGLAENAVVLSNGVYELHITYLGNVTDTSVSLTGGNDVVLFTVIPEPSALVALGAGLTLLLALRRRQS